MHSLSKIKEQPKCAHSPLMRKLNPGACLTRTNACSIEGMMCARLFTKGAAEQILQLCTRRIRDDSGVALLSPEEKQQLLDSFSQDGNRCVCDCFCSCSFKQQATR